MRLITTGRLKEAVLSALAADEQAFADLAELEGATSGRLRAERSGLPGLRAEELVFGRPGATFVNAAFTHTRPGGNRFNDEERGAWYCAFECETALAEVAYHLGRALAEVRRFENVTDYGELLADFIGVFHDLRGRGAGHASLAADPKLGYPAGQALARQLRAAGSDGIVYPSVRRPGGTCLAAFHPASVQNVRQGGIWRLEWKGTAEPAVRRVRAGAARDAAKAGGEARSGGEVRR